MSESPYGPGKKIGKYEVLSILGRGGMGVVYRATDTALDRDVALKVMAPEVATAGAEAIARFRREAKALARVQHPNVVTVHDIGADSDGSPYIVMELLTGQDLQAAVRSAEISLNQRLEIVLQTLEGLSYAHAANVVHRDIKPGNIFVCADGRVKLTDFGLARLAEHTTTQALMGTPAYMSPEQANRTSIDYRSDLFSVGSVTYELLLGCRPFDGDTIPGLLYKIVHQDPDLSGFAARGEYLPFRGIVQRALEKDPARRYQSARAFADALKGALPPPPRQQTGEFAPVGDETVIEIMDVTGASYLMREPQIAYPSGFGPSKESGIRVRRGSAQSFIGWPRIRFLRFVGRREKNDKGTDVWRYDVTVGLVDGTSVVVDLVEDWNMAYMGGGGTGLLFGKTELGDSSVKFSDIRELKVLQIAHAAAGAPGTRQ